MFLMAAFRVMSNSSNEDSSNENSWGVANQISTLVLYILPQRLGINIFTEEPRCGEMHLGV